jgi:hypothetical protein
MFCPECGKEIPDVSKVCGYCGFRLPIQSTPISPEAAEPEQPASEPARGEVTAPPSAKPFSTPAPPPTPAVAEAAPPPRTKRTLGMPLKFVAFGILGIVVLVGGFFLVRYLLGLRPSAPAEVGSLAVDAEDLGDMTAVWMGAGQADIQSGEEIYLYINWSTDLESQVRDFLRTVSCIVLLDDTVLPNVDAYWSTPRQRDDLDGDGDADYATYWNYPIGTLSDGHHVAKMHCSHSETIYDGWDYYDDSIILQLDIGVGG